MTRSHARDSHERRSFSLRVSPESGGLCSAGPHGEAPGFVRARAGDAVDKSPQCGFCRRRGQCRGEQAEDRLVWGHSHKLWSTGLSLVVWHLSWVTRAEDDGPESGWEPRGGGVGFCIGKVSS